MEYLLHRLSGLANAALPFSARACDAPDRFALRMPHAARWALWLGFLILPGSFLLLPVLYWVRTWPQRRSLPRP